MKGLLREAGIFTFYLALAAALTWPLPIALSTAVADRGDPLFIIWVIDWVCHALVHQPLQLFDAPIFYPARFPLALSEHMTGIALLVLPFHLAGLDPITVHNLALLISFALSGYGACALARVVVGDLPASLMAGVFFAFVSFKFDRLSHVHIQASGWIPLALAGLLLFWRTGSRKHAALFCAALVMNGLSNVYWMLFAGFAVVITIVFLFVVSPRPEPWFRKRLALAIAIAAIVLVPFLVPYAIVSKTYRMKRNSIESSRGSATPADWLVASQASALYGWTGPGHPERRLFPGVLPIALALCGLALAAAQASGLPQVPPLRRKLLVAAAGVAIIGCAIALAGRVTIGGRSFSGSDVPFTIAVALLVAALPVRAIVGRSRFSPELWVAALWIVIGFIGSLGENAFLHSFLFRVVEPFRATRTPARWAILAYTGLAVWAAFGAVVLQKRMRFPIRWLILALSIVEVVPRITWTHLSPEVRPVYAWLAKTRPSSAIELPIGWNETELTYVLASTHHHVPIFNGVSGFDTPLHRELSRHAYDSEMLGLLVKHGSPVVIVHPEAAERARGWVEAGQLRLLARFPDGDAVYRIDPNASTTRSTSPSSL